MPTLELSMIVKNGAGSLARCLESVQGIVDRITIGDTGSTDDTLAIAAQYNAHILSLPWANDFAQARNHVLTQAQCDWVLVLDADEMLDEQAANLIPALMRDPAIHGYDIHRWNYVHDAGYRSSGEQAVLNPVVIPQAASYPAYFRTLHTRLFRRNPAIYFEHCVHETIADRMDALKLRRHTESFVIHHFGYVEDAEQQRTDKNNLYYKLALQKVASSKQSCQANLEAGISELDHARNSTAALPYFAAAVVLEPRNATAWLYSGICLTRLGKYSEALKHLDRAAALDPNNLLIFSTQGDAHFQLADYAHASEAYTVARKLGDASALSLAKLGAAEVHLGHHQSGLQKVEQAVAQSPETAELYDIWATSAFLGGQHATACEASEHRLSMKSVTAFNFFLAATLHLHTNKRQKAEAILRAGAAHFPTDPDIRNMLAALTQAAA